MVDRNSILSNPPDILITTPDIVNYAMAFDKNRHALFYSKDGIYPEIVVLDEFHLFYSIFGKNVSLMLKRLEALIDQYSKGSARKIQFIGASATIKNPKDFGSSFFGSDVIHVGTKFEDYDYSRTLKKTTIFAMPLAYRMIDTAAYSLISLLKLNQSDGTIPFKTLVFVNTLTICDMIKSSLGRRASASEEFQTLIEKIGVHNSTYTKQERAEVEEKFNRGEISVLVATNTLEVGVDFKDIDILMLYGVPYSFNSYLQRIGRAGRTRDAIVYVLLNPNNPIDITYYRDALLITLNPDAFLEYSPFPKKNEVLLRKHLITAIFDFCTSNEYDINEVLKSYLLESPDSLSFEIRKSLFRYLQRAGIVKFEDDMLKMLEKIKQELTPLLTTVDKPISEVLKDALKLADLRTAESFIKVELEPYNPQTARKGKESTYKKYGFSREDIDLLKKIKHKRR